jgi:hypothetical protein
LPADRTQIANGNNLQFAIPKFPAIFSLGTTKREIAMENDLESIKRRQDLLEAYMNALEFRLDIVADRIGLINAGAGRARTNEADGRSSVLGEQATEDAAPVELSLASLLRSIVLKQSMHSDDHRNAATELKRLEARLNERAAKATPTLSSVEAALRQVDTKLQTLLDRQGGRHD